MAHHTVVVEASQAETEATRPATKTAERMLIDWVCSKKIEKFGRLIWLIRNECR